MSQYVINIGALPNDGTGDPLRTAFNETNLNFNQIFAAGPVLSNIQIANNTILTTNTNGNLVLAPNGIGVVQSNVNIVPDSTRIRNLGSSSLRWNTVYTQYATVYSDLSVSGNLTVQGNIIQVGNIVTDTLTIQLANAASTANAANGSGITVGANDNIATLLYNSTGNTWTTNIGISSVGNITAPYFIGNGSQLTGITSYANANAVAYGQAGWAGNIIPATSNTYSLGNATNQWNDLYVSNATIYMNNVPLSLTTGNVLTVDGNAVVTATANDEVVASTFATSNSLSIPVAGGNADKIRLYDFNSANTFNYAIGVESGNMWFGVDAVTPTIGFNFYGANTLAAHIDSTGNVTGNYFIGDGSLLTGISAGANIGNLDITGTTISIAAGAPETYINLSSTVEGWAYVQVPTDATANVYNTRIHNDAGNIEFGTGDYSTGSTNYIWTLDNTGNLNLPANGDINFNGGSIAQTLNEDIYIRASDDESDGWSVYNVVDDGGGNILSQTRLEFDQYTIRTDAQGASYTWAFRDTGVLELPGDIYGNVGGNLTVKIVDQAGSDTFIDLQTRSYSGDALISNIRIANPDVTISTASAAHNWTFDNAGNLTVPGNIQSISTGFPFSSGIIGIDNLSPAVITVADSVFPDVVTGRVTISEVNPPVQANGTWYYESVETNQFALYLDAGLTQPVDATGWPGYVDGGLAVSPGYSNLAITGGNVSVVSQFGETWTFEAGGALRIPNDIVSNATIDLDNRASGNTADIRLFAADDIQLQGRDKPDDSENEGGDINIYGGIGAAAATSGFDTGGGGDIQIFGGIGGAGEATGTLGSSGGFVTIRGGDGGMSVDSAVGSGGTVNITAGSAPSAANTSLGGIGGVVNISAGDTTRIDENGGTITLTTGSASGDGTGVAGYVEINIPSSNVGPGGSWTFGGTGTTLNVPANAEIFGANFGNLTVGCAGNTIVTSSDYGANVQNWVFGYTGNLTLPQGGVVYETNIPFGGLEGKTIALKPYGGTDADQQLLVYPTAGADFNHLHLTTGNLWNTEMFLGNDDFYVKLANTGNVVINTNDNGGNTYQLNFTPFGEMRTTGDLFIQTPNGVPNGVTAITGSSGSWESNPRTDLATTNGTGAGLTVTVTETGGYASAIAIVNPGSGYANGDEITVTSGSSSATFTISVANNQWILDTQGELTLPTISLGSGLNEQTVISSQRKLIPPFRWSAVIDGSTPTVVYTATDVQTTSMKVTVQIQHSGLGMEFFEVFATFTGADTYYTVSNRVAPPTIDASTVVVSLNGSNEMQITVTINSGAGTSWVTYDAVEFGIPND